MGKRFKSIVYTVLVLMLLFSIYMGGTSAYLADTARLPLTISYSIDQPQTTPLQSDYSDSWNDVDVVSTPSPTPETTPTTQDPNGTPGETQTPIPSTNENQTNPDDKTSDVTLPSYG